MHAARSAKLAAAERGEALEAPAPCPVERAKDTLERAEIALSGARQAVASAALRARETSSNDPDRPIMKTKDGWLQGYNAQAIVNSTGPSRAAGRQSSTVELC